MKQAVRQHNEESSQQKGNRKEVDGKAKASKLLGKNTISAVGGQAIPPVIRYIAGYKYCAQKVDPGVKVVIGYSNAKGRTRLRHSEACGIIRQRRAS